MILLVCEYDSAPQKSAECLPHMLEHAQLCPSHFVMEVRDHSTSVTFVKLKKEDCQRLLMGGQLVWLKQVGGQDGLCDLAF